MAEDVEISGSQEENRIEDADSIDVVTAISNCSNDISSTESSTDCIIDVVSTVECHSPDLVTNVSTKHLDHHSSPSKKGHVPQSSSCNVTAVKSDSLCNIPSHQTTPPSVKPQVNIPIDSTGNTVIKDSIVFPSSSSSSSNLAVKPEKGVSRCKTECDCDIVIDDGQSNSAKDRLTVIESKSSLSKSHLNDSYTISSNLGISSLGLKRNCSQSPCSSVNGIHSNGKSLCILSRSATPSPSFSRLTPSTPGTPRQRSGSVSGTLYASPSPIHVPEGDAPIERQRAGSLGEIDFRERLGRRENGVRIIDHLDISQLPRPRNPGGVLPQNGHPLPEVVPENDISVSSQRHGAKRKSDGEFTHAGSLFSNFQPTQSSSTVTKSANTSYLISNIIRTTPNKLNKMSALSSPFCSSGSTGLRGWSSSINESVERPQPSSVVDSEGVAKKIARLSDGDLIDSGSWSSRIPAEPDSQHMRNMRTPPERPKPPRRGLSPLTDNCSMTMSGDRFISPSTCHRRRGSPLSSQPSVTAGHSFSHGLAGSEEDIIYRGLSPDVESSLSVGRQMKCRFCNFSTSSYSVLQQHLAKHTGVCKTLKCSVCDYTTNEKTHLRRHRRIHHRTTPVNMLKCGKCPFMSVFPRKMREHYHQIHHESGMPGMVSELAETSLYAPQRYIGSRGLDTDNAQSYPSPYYNQNIDTMLFDRNERAGFSFSNSGRQPPLYAMDQYGIPYSDSRARQEENIASNYLRSIVSSIIQSESNPRQPVTSTITSSSYFLPQGGESTRHLHTMSESCRSLNRSSTGSSHLEVKVKIEPEDGSDIPSRLNTENGIPRASRGAAGASSTYLEVEESRVESNSSGDANLATDLRTRSGQKQSYHDVIRKSGLDPHSDLASSTRDDDRSDSQARHEVQSTSNNDPEARDGNSDGAKMVSCSNTVVKSDTTSRGVQCVLPLIKTELDLDGDYYDYCFTQRFRFRGVDRSVQCNITSSSSSLSSVPPVSNLGSQNLASNLTDPMHSLSESEISEHHSSMAGESRCEHCGISFDDEVIYSIHIGCHSHTDPFKCNVCGKQCANKYGFYSHIMRGHQL